MYHRLFFALWPANTVRQQLAALQARLPDRAGRKVPASNLHITLHFLGQQTEEEMRCVRDAARSVKSAPFQLQINRFGYFRKARVFWAGCRQLPAELVSLQQTLGEVLAPCGYQPEDRPYTPHITLLRKNRTPIVPLPTVEICWPVDAFVLVESVSTPEGVRYDVIEKYDF